MVKVQEDIIGIGLYSSLNEHSVEVEGIHRFLPDDRAWIKEKVEELDINIFKSTSGDKLFKSGKSIPVFIIEEHHGVIPYWYGSVDAGILPHRHGNTLVHIDAHSDFGNPMIGPSFPLFRWPEKDELIQLMQSNDMFIVSACLTEMFSRVIWVYPDWAASDVATDETIYAPHIVVNISIGLETPSINESESERNMCACARPLNLRNNESNPEYCVAIRSGEDDEEIPIQRSECRLLNKILRFEAVSESTIIDLIRRNDTSLKPIRSDGSWILDIDEDYFGVEAPILPMYNANMSDETIDDLSTWVTKNFCAQSAEDELRVDLVFQKIINFVRFDGVSEDCLDLKELIYSYTDDEDVVNHPDIRHKLHERELTYQLACCAEVLKNNSLFSSDIPYISKRKDSSMQFITDIIFCPYEAELELRVRFGTLLSLLYRLNDDQLKALAEVGICLWSSIPGEDQFRLKVCDGFNRPNDESMVPFYTPTDVQELARRAANMTEIIRFFSTSAKDTISTSSSRSRSRSAATTTPPGLITLVRSARDGYVPRSLAFDIEFLIVRGLQDVFNESTASPIATFYDKDLFGGVRGWHKKRFRIKD